MLKRIDHVELVTNQPERMTQFYTEVLEFGIRSRARVERSDAGVPLNIVYLELGDTTVELLSYEGGTIAPAPSGIHLGYNLIALEVADMDEAIAYLESKGVAVVWGPVKLAHAARAEIADRDGNHIELRQWF